MSEATNKTGRNSKEIKKHEEDWERPGNGEK
jgi:hypothetical protein